MSLAAAAPPNPARPSHPAHPVPPARPPRRAHRSLSRTFFAYSLVAPATLAVAVFFYIPMAMSLYWSFTKFNGNADPRWIGLDNYRRVVTGEVTLTALWNTTVFTLVTMTIGPLLGLVSALLLNQNVRFRVFFRNAFFMPVVMPLVVMGTIWSMLLAGPGPINQALALIGITGPDWLSNPTTALLAVAAASIWQGFGFETVVFLAALQSIPRDLYDAAAVDGAGAWHAFRAVTLPALRPTIVFVFLVGLIGAFQTYDQIFVMTKGGPIRASETIVFLLVEQFNSFNLGGASATAYVLVVILAALSVVQMRLGRERS